MSADGERQGISEAATISGPTDSPATSGAGKSADTATDNPIVQHEYKIGFGRKFILFVIFLWLLPFFVSMPAMFVMRLMHGKILDAASLGAMALLLGIALVFVYLQFKAARRTRVALTEDHVNLLVPSWRGPTPFGPFIEAKIPYSEISAVEQRGEIYRAMGVLGLRKASCVVKNDGSRIVLGYETEEEIDAPIPFTRIANELASNASVNLVNKGAVNAGTQLGAAFSGTPSWETPPINAEEANSARQRARLMFRLMIFGFLALVVVAIVLTFLPQIQSLLTTPGG